MLTRTKRNEEKTHTELDDNTQQTQTKQLKQFREHFSARRTHFSISIKMNKANANQFRRRKRIALRLMFDFIFQFHPVFDSADLVSPRISFLLLVLFYFIYFFGILQKPSSITTSQHLKERAYPPSAQVNTIQINVYSWKVMHTKKKKKKKKHMHTHPTSTTLFNPISRFGCPFASSSCHIIRTHIEIHISTSHVNIINE